MLPRATTRRMVPRRARISSKACSDLQRRHPEIGDVDGLGLALRAEICASDGFTPNKALLDRMFDEALTGDLEDDGKKIGLVLDVGGYYKNVITLRAVAQITHDEIDLALALLDQLLARARPGLISCRTR